MALVQVPDRRGDPERAEGADTADSVIFASEPLTSDTSTWLEVPEYSMIHAEAGNGSPSIEIHYLN